MSSKGSQNDQGTSEKEPCGKGSRKGGSQPLSFGAKKTKTLKKGAILVKIPEKTPSKNHQKNDAEKERIFSPKAPKMSPKRAPKALKNH